MAKSRCSCASAFSSLADETYGVNRRSSGRYSYTFVVKIGGLGTMKGQFFCTRETPLRIEKKKVDQGDPGQ